MVHFSFWRRLLMAVPCVLLLTMLLPLMTFAQSHSAASKQASNPVAHYRPDHKAQGQWFEFSHFGKQLPSADSRIKALAQAARVPERSGDNGWTPLGPQPINAAGIGFTGGGLVSGRITAEAVNPTNSNDLWVGAADGGVWNSPDGGHTWKPMTDTQQTLAVGSITVDPHNSNIIYVGTGEANFSRFPRR